jgi:uncharacterized protein
MIGQLTKSQIHQVLNTQIVARLGCSVDDHVYVVPISYVFDGNFIYARSREGMKVAMMRKNPNVCIEVDSIDNGANWRCVVIQGKFQEVKSVTEQNRIVRLLKDRFTPFVTSSTLLPQGLEHAPYYVEKEAKAIVYRISLDKISGKYEKSPTNT